MENNGISTRYLFYNIFIICFTVYWFISYMLQAVPFDFSFILKFLLVVGFLAFFVEWIVTKFTIKEYVIQFIFALFLIFVYIKTGKTNEGILIFFPTIVGIKNIPVKKITKTMFKTLLILEIILLMLSIIQIIPSDMYEKTDKFNKTYRMIRIALQHGNPNYIVIFNLVALYLYSYFDKINFLKCIIIQSILIIFYFIFYCKTGIILGSIVVWGCLFIKIKDSKNTNYTNKIFAFIVRHSFLFFFLFVFIIAKYGFNTFVFNILNKVIQSRIHEAFYYIKLYGIQFLPRIITYYYICDNSQVVLLVNLGLIFTILYVYIHDKTISILLKNNRKVEVFFLIIYLLYSYCEITFIKPFSNFSVLFLVYFFYKDMLEVSDE